MIDCYTRAPKQIGDFGEGLVTYAMIRRGFEIAYVDHIGADLIAARSGERYAVSVKTRLFRPDSKESRGYVVEREHLEKLASFAQLFALRPLLAVVLCLADERKVHLFIMPADRIAEILTEAQHGYSLRCSPVCVRQLSDHPLVDYFCWSEEQMGSKLFTPPTAAL